MMMLIMYLKQRGLVKQTSLKKIRIYTDLLGEDLLSNSDTIPEEKEKKEKK